MKAKTVIVDVDGCVLRHHGKGACNQWRTYSILPDVVAAFNEWERLGYCVVLMSARKECCRHELEIALQSHGLFWDHLILGVTSGERVLVNDVKTPAREPSARTVVLPRNEGLREVTNL